MSKLWKDLKENMKEWSSAAVEKAEEVGKIAVAKTEELTKISKIKIEIRQIQKELAGVYEDLGRYTYHQAKEENVANFTGNEEFFGLIQKGEALKESIKIKEDEIEAIKQEYGIDESTIEEGTAEEESTDDSAEKKEE
jgi:predicted mannosyl-3-phosphoglycerate phosphatase (HAD superfamily)